MKPSSKLSVNLKILRKKMDIGQKELAAFLNVSVGTISNYENGVHSPDMETLIRIADFYDVSTDYLLGHNIHVEKMDTACLAQYERYISESVLQFIRYLLHEGNSHLENAFRDFEQRDHSNRYRRP